LKTLSEIGTEIGNLVEEKNSAYGSAFEKAGQILAVLYPNGIKPEQYSDMLATVRILDKLFRIATNKKAFNEEPWKDIAGYGILGVAKEQPLEPYKDEGDDHIPF
jgi:hypothetical protein